MLPLIISRIGTHGAHTMVQYVHRSTISHVDRQGYHAQGMVLALDRTKNHGWLLVKRGRNHALRTPVVYVVLRTGRSSRIFFPNLP